MENDRRGDVHAGAPKRRKRVSVVGIAGELFITAGALVFLFLGWQLWLNDLIVGADQDKAGSALGESWSTTVPAHQHTTPGAPRHFFARTNRENACSSDSGAVCFHLFSSVNRVMHSPSPR